MATEAIAVAIMVDSSLALASQWPTVLVTCISPLLTRLVGNRANTTFNIAFVTYAMADTRPTPLVTLRYFAHPHQVTKEFKEDPQKLGIGRTGGGGRHGMAVLEGYVAAIEMFDIFTSTRENDHRESASASQPLPPTHCQIIHVASSSPDLARIPLWNQNSELDNVSWKTLPDELRKRNINLSMILLRPDNTLSEFYKHVVSRPEQPWFPVKTGYNVLLSGFPTQATAQTPAPAPSPALQAAKRPVASPVPDRPAEPKRARTNLPQPSPTPVGPTQPQEPEKVAAPNQTLPPAPAPAPAPPTTTAPRQGNIQPPAGLMAVFQRMQSLDAEVKTHYREAQEARQSGRTQDEENARKQMQMKMVLFNRLKAALQAMKDQQQVKVQVQAQAQEASGSTNQATIAGNSGNDVAPQVQAEASNKPAPQPPLPPAPSRITPQINAPPPQPPKPPSVAPHDPQQLAEALELMRSKLLQPPQPSQPSQTPSAIPSGLRLPPNMTPEVAAQMQKLIEQQRGRSPRQAHLNTQNPPPMPPVAMQQQPQPQPQAGPSKPIPQEWYGALTWTGIDPASQTRMEVSSQVLISGPEIRKETWPPNLTLTPSSERAVPTQDLHAWIKRFQPKMCTIVPNPRAGINESNFKSLNNLLVEKSLYALASWDLPSTGKKEVMMVIFPFPSIRPGTPLQLVCAVFPDTGVPELPRTISNHTQQPPGPPQQVQATPSINPMPIPNTTPVQQMPPGFANWTNEMKTAFFTRMMSYRQTQVAQQQQQQAHQLQQQQQAGAGGQQIQQQNAVMGGQAMPQHTMNQFGGHGQSVSASPPNIGGFMGGIGMNALHQNAGGFHPMGVAGVGGGGVPQGLGNMQNLSLEMLQSFMQRNPDGTGGQGHG
ncbi:hypothetical protein BD410DRAFT_897760 [Rickenella mellea]|uniref:Mediator of RNA polymerase II transcription subunit 25 von Willebrand factor type A domain-containing protein n=1 Tax=Rickenella mellea TaxID=50990 RepID=A0A4Y7Q7A3_9AGAM|nr:hypothetical protein BD410DRAFT_897760 [Rickenella mellea]